MTNLTKIAIIRKLPNGKYRVMSEKGKNLGTYDSKSQAEKRLKQVEYFKHLEKDKNKADDKKEIDLSSIDDFSYSAILRKLRKQLSNKNLENFLKFYYKQFNDLVNDDIQKPDIVALQKTLLHFKDRYNILIPNKIIKKAFVSELGNPKIVGKYLSDIVKFLTSRMSEDKRPNALNSLKRKISQLNENELSNKNLPASASMGQSITLIKHVLFNHNPSYIREVLNNIVENL